MEIMEKRGKRESGKENVVAWPGQAKPSQAKPS